MTETIQELYDRTFPTHETRMDFLLYCMNNNLFVSHAEREEVKAYDREHQR